MTIRNILTSAAMVAVLGLAAGSAYADDSHVDEGFTASANANYPGTVFVYNGDSDVNEGDILSTDGFEQASLPKHIVETLATPG